MHEICIFLNQRRAEILYGQHNEGCRAEAWNEHKEWF